MTDPDGRTVARATWSNPNPNPNPSPNPNPNPNPTPNPSPSPSPSPSPYPLLPCRQQELSRRLYFTSARGAAALACKELRVLRAGVKAFERDASAGVGCSLRIVQELALPPTP